MKRRLWLGALLALGTLVGNAQAFTHIVSDKDTLASIAERYYGDGSLYPKIFEANREILKDPDKIKIGQRLRIP